MDYITTQNFRILCDFMDIRNFLTEIYEQDWRNGVPAPFLEYALSSSWMDTNYTHRWRIWKDGEKIAALVFHENPISDTYISLRPGYEALADELVAYASSDMPKQNGKNKLVLFAGQTAIMEAARRAGYVQTGGYIQRNFDFRKPLDHPLPEGFRFVEPEKLDAAKIDECCWKGFDHEASEGPWDGDPEDVLRLMAAPHATYNRSMAIENERGEYVCYAGMWWTPENHLAYMEPLCTVPQYRRKGLAAAALSELYRRMKPLGATHMTGGGDPFYEKLGFDLCVGWTFWEKENELFVLEIPSPAHQAEYERIMDRWEHLEENIQPELMRRGNTPFEKWLAFCEDDRQTGSMLSTKIPCTLYFMLNAQREIVGSIVLNHEDTKRGHLHAGIVPWCRGKGYGTAMLALALKECQKKGILKVHICPNSKENKSAVHTILSNGGHLLEEFMDGEQVIERYEIALD